MLPRYDCCRHCPDDCTMQARHRFPCNACQPRVTDQPPGDTPDTESA
jgi:hypothetical protein